MSLGLGISHVKKKTFVTYLNCYLNYTWICFFLFVYRMLRKDKEEVEAIKHAKALEAEKAMYSVR